MTRGEQGKGGVRSAGRKGDTDLGFTRDRQATPRKSAKADLDARTDRLRAALRENLKRRKSQARGRSQAGADGTGAPHDSAGFVPEIAPDKPKG
jgi:hypothetical protein